MAAGIPGGRRGGGALADVSDLERLDLLELPEALVTGEAVQLDLRPASFGSRALGLLLDLAVVIGLLIAAVTALTLIGPAADASARRALGLSLVVLVAVGAPVLVESVTRGRSLGKLAAGLRVVRDDGGPVRFRQSLIRGLLAVAEIYLLPFLALISSLFSARGKRLGDHLAGTFVIRVRTPKRESRPVPMPPHLVGWAQRTDLGRIPDPLASAARRFLLRSGSLHPGARARTGVRLADDLARYVAPPPPAGTLPEDFLCAVLAERRVRDLRRLLREQETRRRREADRRAAPPLSPAGTSLIGGSPREKG